MNKVISLAFLFVLTKVAFSQKDTAWLNANGKKTTRDSAIYFRPKPIFENGKYKITDYYVSTGKMQGFGYSLKEEEEIYDGIVTFFDEAGILTEEWNFKQGKYDGFSKSYYPTGKIKEIIYYENGKAQGENKLFFEDGALMGLKYYVDDKKEGRMTKYTHEGKIKETVMFHNGKAEGEDLEYNDDGSLHTRSFFVHDKLNGPQTVYYESGKTMYTDTFINDKKEGLHIGYHENGNIQSKGIYKNDEPVGEWRSFFANGNPEMIRTIKDGMPEGKETWFYPSGKIRSESNYTNGQLNGPFIAYLENGMKEKEMYYTYGEESGPWKYFYEEMVAEEVPDDTSMIILDTISSKEGVYHTSKILTDDLLHTGNSELNIVLLNVYASPAADYIFKTYNDYKPSDNEIAFFYQYPLHKRNPVPVKFFRIGKEVETAIRKDSMIKQNISRLLESRIFGQQEIEGSVLLDALEQEVK